VLVNPLASCRSSLPGADGWWKPGRAVHQGPSGLYNIYSRFPNDLSSLVFFRPLSRFAAPARIAAVLEKASDGLTAAEAARRLGVDPQTVRNWIRAGKLPAMSFGPDGTVVRVDPAELDKLGPTRRPKDEVARRSWTATVIYERIPAPSECDARVDAESMFRESTREAGNLPDVPPSPCVWSPRRGV